MLTSPAKKLLPLAVSVVFCFGVASNATAASTGSGLDQIVEIIHTDKRLNKKVAAENIEEAAIAADAMNQIIVEAIVQTGTANDGNISTADTRELNDYIFANHAAAWAEHHGDDEDGAETGFHLVQNNGARTKLFGKNAINKVADSIYHLGFETHRKNRLLNEDGTKNASFAKVGKWINGLMVDDLASGRFTNPAIAEVVGSTGTGLDVFINTIYNDPGLKKKISTGDMREGAAAADGMNAILVKSIRATEVAADGNISADDVRALVDYIRANHLTEWVAHHGDDEDGEETGFHLVQSDGAKTKMYGKNAINKVADGIYHLGFGTNANGKRLINEDGNNNVSVKNVAKWLNQLLADDLANGKL